MKGRSARLWLLVPLLLILLPLLCVVYAFRIEPEWLVVRRLALNPAPAHRIVHISDIHYKGDRRLLERVVRKINKLSPDFVCFTGDIVEDKSYLRDALEILGRIRRPMFGVPGNHDVWRGASLAEISGCFKATGGAWLVDQKAKSPDGKLTIIGSSGKLASLPRSDGAGKRLLLVHYPAFADEIAGAKYDLILAGHSHGGQVRIPFRGALKLPFSVARYDRGLYATRAGPLYVNPGLGTWHLPARFLCRPEITLVAF